MSEPAARTKWIPEVARVADVAPNVRGCPQLLPAGLGSLPLSPKYPNPQAERANSRPKPRPQQLERANPRTNPRQQPKSWEPPLIVHDRARPGTCEEKVTRSRAPSRARARHRRPEVPPQEAIRPGLQAGSPLQAGMHAGALLQAASQPGSSLQAGLKPVASRLDLLVSLTRPKPRPPASRPNRNRVRPKPGRAPALQSARCDSSPGSPCRDSKGRLAGAFCRAISPGACQQTRPA